MKTVLAKSVADYLYEVGAYQLNPVWNNYERNFIVGYHYEVKTEKLLMEVRDDLEQLFKIDKLDYSLNEFNPNYPTTRFIIYMNNKEEIKGKPNSDVSD